MSVKLDIATLRYVRDRVNELIDGSKRELATGTLAPSARQYEETRECVLTALRVDLDAEIALAGRRR